MKMGVVCRYFTIFAALNSVFMVAEVLGQHDHDHDHDHHHGHDHGEEEHHDGIDAFLTVKNHVVHAELKQFESEDKAAILSYDEVYSVVSILLGRLNCTQRSLPFSFNCSECSSVLTNQIFNTLDITKSGGLQEDGFESAAVILLASVSEKNLAVACGAGNQTYNKYRTNLMSIKGTPGTVTEEEMMLLLGSLAEHYTPQTLGKCFSTSSLFEDVDDHDLGATVGEMEHLSAIILASFVEGYCIGQSEYPDPESFLDDIIALYGHDGVIPLGDFELMLKNLDLGNSDDHGHDHDHDHDDHDDHDHDHDDHDHDHDDHDHDHDDHDDHDHDHDDHDHDDHDHDHDDHDHDHDHDDHDHDHDHRRKRADRLDTRTKRETGNHDHDDHDHDGHDHDDHGHDHHDHDHDHDFSNALRIEEVADSCFSAEELMTSHGLHPEDGLNEDQLKLVCPSLLQQLLSDGCSDDDHHDHGTPSGVGADAYLYGTISVFAVSLCSLGGGLLLPLLKDDHKDMILGMMIAMAVSTLTGDALIHLIPMATGLHVHEVPHDHSSHDHGHDHDHDTSYVWKTFLTLVSIYLFFLLETTMSFFCVGEHIHTHGQAAVNARPMALEQAKFEQIPETDTPGELPQPNGHKIRIFQFGSLPIMILLSDAFHNFCDGLAMGASFAASIGTGLSTSVAVFCHELPHELGDLAILLKSGMQLKWALFLNFLSALTCFLGFYIGIAVGSTLLARQWILSATAGMFLYVGLVDMMPQILHADQSKRPVLTFVLQNIGFLIGAFTILAISFLEEAISINVGG